MLGMHAAVRRLFVGAAGARAAYAGPRAQRAWLWAVAWGVAQDALVGQPLLVDPKATTLRQVLHQSGLRWVRDEEGKPTG
eukprot:gene2302-1449_t